MSMDYHTTVIDFFVAQWAAHVASYPIKHAGLHTEKEDNNPYVRPVVQSGTRNFSALGKTHKRVEGNLAIDVFRPVGSAPNILVTIGNALATALDGQTTGAVKFRTVEHYIANLERPVGMIYDQFICPFVVEI